MMLLFGKTPLLRDVKRGLKGSGNTESVNRLAVIMLLTLSIVTLAAVQGYTGTLVDEKTATAPSWIRLANHHGRVEQCFIG